MPDDSDTLKLGEGRAVFKPEFSMARCPAIADIALTGAGNWGEAFALAGMHGGRPRPYCYDESIRPAAAHPSALSCCGIKGSVRAAIRSVATGILSSR
jgi:hypothetical protein